jgi:60 kDa SS-A/Ro ribonucleoprotein
MQGTVASGMPYLSAAMGSAALAMAFARREPNARILAFHDRIWPVDLTPQDRLDRAVSAIVREPRATDASLPMRYAREQNWDVDAFVLLTDNETWSGEQHPVQALTQYRQATGLPAKLAVVAMAANRYSIADPNDAYQLDVAGFDSSVPAVLAEFVTM